MESGPNGEEGDELYNINLMPSELFLKLRREIQGFRVGLNLEVYINTLYWLMSCCSVNSRFWLLFEFLSWLFDVLVAYWLFVLNEDEMLLVRNINTNKVLSITYVMLNSSGWFSNFLAWAEYPFKSNYVSVGERAWKRPTNTSNKLLKFIRARIGSEGPCWRIMWLRLPLWIRDYPWELVKIQRQSKNWDDNLTPLLFGKFFFDVNDMQSCWFFRRLSCRNVLGIVFTVRLLLACKLSSLISYLYTYTKIWENTVILGYMILVQFYNAPSNEYQAKLVLKPLSCDRNWKFMYEPLRHEVRILSKKIPVTKFLNLQVWYSLSLMSHGNRLW